MIALLFSVQAQLSVSINVNVNKKFLTWLEEQNDYEFHEVNCGWRCAVCFSSVGSRISCRKMAEESAEALSHVSDATTTTEEATITDVITVTPLSSSSGTELYFDSAVVIIGVIGTAANALILYALVASKQHNKLVLIVNQNALDLFSCIFLVVTYSVKFFSITLTGWLGYWLCKLIFAQSFLWSGITGSIINLASVHSSFI